MMSDTIKAADSSGYKPEQMRSEVTHLCDRCLAVWPRVPFYEDGAEIFRIEEKVEELLNSTCQVCQILGIAMRVHQERSPSLERPLLCWSQESDRSGAAVFQYSKKTRKGNRLQSATINVWYPKSSIPDVWRGLETSGGGLIDFEIIKSWMDKCRSHSRCKSGANEGPRNLRVIDCTERAVVLAPVACEYVALSYVWGGLVPETESISELLTSTLPRTIEDSIKATLLLGYQYLWVE